MDDGDGCREHRLIRSLGVQCIVQVYSFSQDTGLVGEGLEAVGAIRGEILEIRHEVRDND